MFPTPEHVTCSCGARIARREFARWSPENAVASATCRRCGKRMTVRMSVPAPA